MIRIRSKQDGFRRCGVSHSKEPVEYPEGQFSAEELKVLNAEPMLVVEMVVEKEEPKGKSKKASKEGGKKAAKEKPKQGPKPAPGNEPDPEPGNDPEPDKEPDDQTAKGPVNN